MQKKKADTPVLDMDFLRKKLTDRLMPSVITPVSNPPKIH
jgi:hypothetical protein